MSIRAIAAAAVVAATAGTAGAQVIYSGGGYYGTAPGFYGSGYSVPGVVPANGFVATPSYLGNNYGGLNNRGVIYGGAPVTPLYSTPLYSSYSAYPSSYNTGVYNSYTSGIGLSNRGLAYNTLSPGYSYNNFGTGYSGVYNAGYYTPGYVGSGFNVITVPTTRFGGSYNTGFLNGGLRRR
jgi:hypothetical protein